MPKKNLSELESHLMSLRDRGHQLVSVSLDAPVARRAIELANLGEWTITPIDLSEYGGHGTKTALEVIDALGLNEFIYDNDWFD